MSPAQPIVSAASDVVRRAGLPLVLTLLAAVCFWSARSPDSQVVLTSLAGLLGIVALVSAVQERRAPWWLLGLTAAYAAAVVASWAAAPPGADGIAVVDTLAFAIVIVATAVLVPTPRDRMGLMAALLVFLALVVVGAIGPRSNLETFGRYMYYPAVAHWGAYPEIGLLGMFGAVAAAAIAIAARVWPLRVAVAWLAAGFALVPWLVTSRGAVVSLGIAVGWLCAVAMVKWWKRWAMLALICAGVLIVGAGWLRGDVARLTGGYTTGGAALSVSERATHWRAAKHMIVAHPFLGVGPGRFPEELTKYETIRPMRHAHNMLLHVAAETGLLALIPFLALWGRALVRSLRAAGRDGPGMAAFALHGLLAAFFIRSVSDQFLSGVHSSLRTSLLIAILLGLAEVSGRSRTTDNGSQV